MSMRTSSAGALLLLAACTGATEETAAADADDDSLIECAVSGAAVFARACRVEQSRVEGELVLVVRHPDGGFRRFDVTANGVIIRVAVKDIPSHGRDTQGVRIMNVRDDERVVALARVVGKEEENGE